MMCDFFKNIFYYLSTNQVFVLFIQLQPALLISQTLYFKTSTKENSRDWYFLDLTKAFDIFDHNLLRKKLSGFGLSKSAVNSWFRAYFTGGTQSICINDDLSDPEAIPYMAYHRGVSSGHFCLLCA